MVKRAKRIENEISGTAKMTCFTRAVSYYEKESYYRSNDYIAPKLVPLLLTSLLKLNPIRRLYNNKISPKGIYEYTIARTKFFDSVFYKAVQNKYEQILIFGAGFDSRGLRFLSNDSVSKVFELDMPIIQSNKIEQLKKRKIMIPPDIIFIPMDFNKESLTDRLLDYGFKKNKKNLFLLEGLLMYLTEQAVNSTFQIIDEFSAAESEILFDSIYLSVLRRENLFYGEQDIYNYVSKVGEGWTFGIEKSQIELFLNKYHFSTLEVLDSDKLEKKYFTDVNDCLVAKVNGTHCIINAIKKW